MTETTTIAGIEVPSTDPLFVAIVAGFHIPLGLACVIAGAVAMLAAKGRGRHSTAGTTYFWCLLTLFASVLALAAMRWAENRHLLALGTSSFAAAWLGRAALRRSRRQWVRLHIVGMGTSYTLMLIAFYVDNGKQLPLWKDLPAVTYWSVPLGIALPLIIYAVLRHPVVRPRSPRA